VGIWGSNYSDKVGIWGSNYTDKIGIFGSNYASDKVGIWGSNYARDKIGIYSSNYSDLVGLWGSNYASDKVGIWGSNYARDKIGIYSSNYTERLIAGLGTATNYWTKDAGTNIYLNQTGNVGIGTQTSLTNKLQVQGTMSVSGLITATQTTAGTNDILNMSYDTRNGIRFIQRYVGVDDVRYDLIQKVANVDKTPSLTFYNGNVGIGATNPQLKLDIQGTNPTIRLLDINSDGNAIIQFRELSDLYGMDIAYIGNLDNKMYIRSYNNSATAVNNITIDRASGNVGIGTITIQSSYKLQVQGNNWVENQLVFNDGYKGLGGINYACNKIALYGGGNTPTTSSQYGFGVADGTLEYFGGAHKFYTGTTGGTGYGSERMKVWNNGAVSIQTTGYALPTNNNYMRSGSLTIGNFNSDYGWGTTSWNANVNGTAGLLLECSDYTEIAVHDANARIVSFLAYYANNITIGRDMGHGATNLNCCGAIAFGSASAPSFTCDVPNNGAGNSGYYYMRYFDVNNVLSYGYTYLSNVCARFGGALWCGSWVASSSDARIKEDIEDINDDTALNMILAIEPKTYKYIDKVAKGNKKVYGFIAQQIKEVLPEAVSLQSSYIPNIMLMGDYDNEIITLTSQPTKVIIKLNDKIKCYDKDDNDIDVKVVEIIDELTFKITHEGTRSKDFKYTENKIFVCGTEVDDFHTISKEYIFTLNVCATQELHRRIKSQDERIKELETKMTQILNYISI